MSLSAVLSRATALAGAVVLAAGTSAAGLAATALPAVAAPTPSVPSTAPRPSSAAADGPIGGPLMGSHGTVSPKGAPVLPSGVNSTAWVLADADTGAVLAARDPHRKYLPASTLKTLTALTLLPRLTDRRRTVVATAQDVNIDGTRVGLVVNGKYSVDMLFQCMLMMSGNDCATALAEAAGGVPKTLALMNAEAHRLGAYDTHAATPSGLDGPGQATSAYDLALILRQAIRNPDFCRYNTTRQGTVPAQPPKYGSFQFNNDNKLTWNYPGVLASKNGYTDAARHTYVGAARHGKRTLVVTLMHGERQPVDMWQQAAALLDWGFALPAGVQPVGRLVEPGEVDAARNAASGNAAAAQSASASGGRPSPVSNSGTGSSSGIGVLPPVMAGVAVLTVLLVGALAWRSRRPRY